MALFPGTGWAGTTKVKPIWILLKQETVSGSGISWAICKYAPCSRQTTMPAPHHSVFLQAGCPSCRPTNSVKALKASFAIIHVTVNVTVFWEQRFSFRNPAVDEERMKLITNSIKGFMFTVLTLLVSYKDIRPVKTRATSLIWSILFRNTRKTEENLGR